MGVLSNLGKAAVGAAKSPAFRNRAKALAKSAAMGTAKTAWNWSGASDIPALQGAANLAGRVHSSREKLLADKKSNPAGAAPPALPLGNGSRPTPALAPPAPAPLALPAPAGKKSPAEKKAPAEKTSAPERRRMSEETKQKISNADQRAETRRLSSQQKGTISDAKIKSETNRAAMTSRKNETTQADMAADIHFIAGKMKEQGSLAMNPFTKKDKDAAGGGGGGLLSSLASTAISAAGGGLMGKALKYGAKIPGVSKAAGFVSKIPVLGKLVGAGALAAGASGVANAATGAAGSAATGAAGSAVGDVAAKAGGEAAAKTGAKALGKSILKKIPLLGLLAGAVFASNRAMAGDMTGAGMELASGVAGTLPGPGTAASIGIDAALAAKDYNAEQEAAGGEKGESGADPSAVTPSDKASANSLAPPAALAMAPTADKPIVYNSPLRQSTTGPLSPQPTVAATASRYGVKPPAVVTTPPVVAPSTQRLPVALSAAVAPIASVAPALRDGLPVKAVETRDSLAPTPTVSPVMSSAATTAPASDEEGDSRTVDLLTALVTNMLDESKGIFVKPVKDVFDSGSSSMFGAKPAAPGLTDSNGNAVTDGSGQPVSTGISAAPTNNEGLTPTASPGSVKVAPLIGSGFVPNVERAETPRPYMGGGAVPLPRQDISKATAKEPSLAIATPSGPTVGVSTPKRGKGKKFDGFGQDVDGHIAEASAKYGIEEKVLRGFVKMEAGYDGAMSPTGAIGTGQFIQPTWDGLAKTKEGKEIGMRKIGADFRKDTDPRFDKRTNTLATGLLAKQNAEALTKAGLPASGENLYMMHNVGPGVIPALKGQPVSEETITAMKHNGMKDGQSATDFVAMQKRNFNKHYESANAEGVKKGGGDASVAGSKPVGPAASPAVAAKAPATTVVKAAPTVQTPPATTVAKAPAQAPALTPPATTVASAAPIVGAATSAQTSLAPVSTTPPSPLRSAGPAREPSQAIVAQAQPSSIAPNNTAPMIRRPAVTQQMQSSRDLSSSQQEAKKAEAPPPPSVIVAGSGGSSSPAPSKGGSSGGDAKPALIVRNNESSLTRVTDNMISRTLS